MRRWTVGDVMTKSVVTVTEGTPYKEIVDILARHAVSAVPVVDDHGCVVGVVSEADLLHKLELAGLEPHVRVLERKRTRMVRAKASADSASDLMTSPPVVIIEAASLTAAAKIMDKERVKRLPVVDGAGRLLGIISRRDLLGVYLRDDEALRQEIEDQVLLRTLWIEPGTVSVAVAQGVVTLGGTVDRRSTVPLVVRLVETVSGVVEVIDNLTYHYDDTAQLNYHHFMGPTVKETVP